MLAAVLVVQVSSTGGAYSPHHSMQSTDKLSEHTEERNAAFASHGITDWDRMTHAASDTYSSRPIQGAC